MPKMPCDMDCFNCKYPDCINDVVNETRTLTRAQKDRRNERLKERYYEDKAKGMCVRCHVRPAQKNRVFCVECWLKENRYYKNSKRHNVAVNHQQYWDYNNLCHFCGKPVVPGKKTCPEHYKQLCKRIAEARKNIDNSVHIWVTYNDIDVFYKKKGGDK